MHEPAMRRYREQAFRSFNWVTYFQGMPAGAHTRRSADSGGLPISLPTGRAG